MNKNPFTSYCASCRKSLLDSKRVLLVERDIGRCFCNEECIYQYFQPTIDEFSEKLNKIRAKDDTKQIDSNKYIYYRQKTLLEPEELWVTKTESNDHHFTYIREFKDNDLDRSLWCVAISFVLDGEPSFVLLDFITSDENLVNQFRKTNEMNLSEKTNEKLDSEVSPEEVAETIIAKHFKSPVEELQQKECSLKFQKIYLSNRKEDDIPIQSFLKYEQFVEGVLEDPDELWVNTEDYVIEACVFISRFVGDERNSFWMIILSVPQNVGDYQAIEVLLTIPTQDINLVNKFRRGFNTLNKYLGTELRQSRVA